MLSLVRTSTVSAALGLEGAHYRAVAEPPTPNADRDAYPLLSRQDGESLVAEHKAAALEAAEVLTTLGVIDVEEYSTCVQ